MTNEQHCAHYFRDRESHAGAAQRWRRTREQPLRQRRVRDERHVQVRAALPQPAALRRPLQQVVLHLRAGSAA